ncbi:hypothetical protein [Burkholderia sp. 22313]|uniref:hypothetical protein n=1 Tax=Burkholderia sp. 22313 TaxID=3453908 RepID=UPI003F85E4E9
MCNFILLPAVSSFEMLAYTIGVFMIGTGLALRHPRTAALADFAGLERSCGAAAHGGFLRGRSD